MTQMLAISKIFHQLLAKVTVIVLSSLVLFAGLPITSVQAAGYYSGDYSTDNIIEQKMGRDANVTPDTSGNEYIKSGQRAGEVIPKDLGTGKRQKNPLEMLQRAGEELGNDQIQRAFGSEDYERSEIEQELARNKALRGDYDARIQRIQREAAQQAR